jgi:hypothetical protein
VSSKVLRDPPFPKTCETIGYRITCNCTNYRSKNLEKMRAYQRRDAKEARIYHAEHDVRRAGFDSPTS